MILKLLPLFLLTLKTSRCSLIIDQGYQKGLYLSDYCPNMKYCREGSHVMCMFYDPNNVIGPRCYNAVNASITADLANRLLDVTNTIRSKIAKGKETGKDGVLLPRGYGIFRLKWDSELATFAQVLANQCVLRHDMCRASKRFPNPSQTAGLVRFTFPDWQPMSKVNGISNTPGVTNAKLVYAITQSLKSWYGHKTSVTEQMIRIYPDWSATPTNQMGRLYLDMIYGPATHIGCGMSGYSEYVYYENHRQGIHNSLQLICNFSGGARKGAHTYETDPPIPGQGFSAKCGCPPGSREDNDCLCNEAEMPPEIPQITCPLGEPSGNCEPALVLLPIFTIEDAPPEKLYQFAEEMKNPLKNYILQRIDNTTDAADVQGRSKGVPRVQSSNEMFDLFNEKDIENEIMQHALDPSSAQSTAPPYYKKDNKSDAIFGQSRFQPRARARTSSELFEFIREKGGESALNWPHANKLASLEVPAPSFNELHNDQQSSPTFRMSPNPKPPPLPPSPSHRSPAFRPPPHANRRPPSIRRPPPPPPPPPRIPPPPPPRIEHSTALQTHVQPRSASQKQRGRPPPTLPPKHRQQTKKSSIFTRVAQFQLPGRRNASPYKVIKKDVEPRKDFSNLNKVVNDYLKRHPGYRIINSKNENSLPKEDIQSHAEEKSRTDTVPSDNGLNRAEETIINFNQYMAQKNNSNFDDKEVDIKEDNDNRLLLLLDTLEREVKNIALDGSEKQLFDAKIRKIYGSIVGKTALQKFPKSLLFNTPEPEAAEIDFGETKSSDDHFKIANEPKPKKILEPKYKDDNRFKIMNEPKPRTHYKVDKRTDQAKTPFIQSHKWKNKLVDSFDQKKYNADVSSYRDRKPSYRHDENYKDKLENTYGDIHHKRMDELDHRYNENMNKKYNENHLDHEYNEVPHKFNDNFDHSYDRDKKSYNDEPVSSKIKYNADKTVFREFEHNSLGSQEDVTPRNYKNVKDNQDLPEMPLMAKDRDKKKRSEKRHRKRAKSLGSLKDDDILSLERRKYYQEKLDNIRRKLRIRKSWNNDDSKNERSLRRMHTKNRDSSKMRSRTKADNFYMPERARFLHGF